MGGDSTVGKIGAVTSLTIGLVLMAFTLSYVGFGELVSSMQEASIYWFFLSLLLLPVPFLIRAWRWRLLLLPTKNTVGYFNALGITFVGSLTNNLIPIRAGEFFRALLMGRRETVAFFEVFSSIVVERILDLLSIVTLATIMLFLFPLQLALPEWAINSLRITGTFTLSVLVVLILGTKNEEALMHLVRKITSATPMPKSWKWKLNIWLEEVIRGAKSLSYNSTLVSVLLVQSFAICLICSLQVYMMFQMFTIDVSPFVALLGSMLFTLSFIFPAPPGYVGSYETFWSLVFTGLGLSLVEVLPVGLLTHLLNLVFVAVTGCLSAIWFSLTFREFHVAIGTCFKAKHESPFHPRSYTGREKCPLNNTGEKRT
jgi:uncharacterized protein (TIRG00374 family)